MISTLAPPERHIYPKRKVIHDSVWGTCTYDPWEVSLLDHGVFQRLRGLKQTGFAYLTYPTAEHSRFQHTLGVVEAASRLFDSIIDRLEDGGLTTSAAAARGNSPVLGPAVEPHERDRWRLLLRMAALVHDTGHSVFSHSSERIYGLVRPMPDLQLDLAGPDKEPGPAEVIVYLMVTSAAWQEEVNARWPEGGPVPPTPAEWERIGRWVMGQEMNPTLQWLCDIISGPLDADKLDYVFRDGYSAGVPVGYDLERLVTSVCVDVQPSALDATEWWRLTIPVRGINALEQLVMGRLVLNSYLYHHQKCRAAETAFERSLAREYFESETILGKATLWELFSLQDADSLAFSRESRAVSAVEVRRLYARDLRVRVVEFHPQDADKASARTSAGLRRLAAFEKIRDWGKYQELLNLEDRLSSLADLPPGAILLDIPKNPSYADLRNLKLPSPITPGGESPGKVLAYRDWIQAYKEHRYTIRVFAPRGEEKERQVWAASQQLFREEFAIDLPSVSRVYHSGDDRIQ